MPSGEAAEKQSPMKMLVYTLQGMAVRMSHSILEMPPTLLEHNPLNLALGGKTKNLQNIS